MTIQHTYLTTTIPYVNAKPHLGHVLELVQADVFARHYRKIGNEVRFQIGTDDNSLKNVLAAATAGVEVQDFVDGNAQAFLDLRHQLSLSADDTIRTSRDPRHRPGVEKLWRACAESGDLYRKHYEGLYCVGCEQFYVKGELTSGRCPEHGTEPQLVAEENWFFRLSRYAQQLYETIESGRLHIEPIARRNEVLAFIEGGLNDISVSRSVSRARGWGIRVPGDDDQVIWVWWDALANYLSALDYGSDGDNFRRWWTESDRRIHTLGKGVIRMHAVYWPAILLSAGIRLPTQIAVHDYLTVDGRKISKSAGTAINPAELVATYGADAIRWWLLREVPRVGDTDFTVARLAARTNDELVNGFGNLIHRVVSMVHKYREGVVPARVSAPLPEADNLAALCNRATDGIAAALTNFDFRSATKVVWDITVAANRFVNHIRPWELAKAEQTSNVDRTKLDAVLAELIGVCRLLATLLTVFLPEASTRIARQCTPVDGVLPKPEPLFRRIDV